MPEPAGGMPMNPSSPTPTLTSRTGRLIPSIDRAEPFGIDVKPVVVNCAPSPEEPHEVVEALTQLYSKLFNISDSADSRKDPKELPALCLGQEGRSIIGVHSA